MPRRKILYHGTSLHRWQRLKASGWAEVLYLAESVSGTEMYRLNAVQEDESDGISEEANAEIVAAFDLDKLAHLGQLQPDWDDVPTNMDLFPEASWPGQVSWQDSLRRLGTCAYTGPIAAAFIKVRKI